MDGFTSKNVEEDLNGEEEENIDKEEKYLEEMSKKLMNTNSEPNFEKELYLN